MSSNNQLIVLKKGKNFLIFHNTCVDNEFKPSKESLIGKANTMEQAIKIANEFMAENIVEYGLSINI